MFFLCECSGPVFTIPIVPVKKDMIIQAFTQAITINNESLINENLNLYVECFSDLIAGKLPYVD